MTEWYFAYEDKQTGPHDLTYAKAFVREHPGAYCWKYGWMDWKYVFDTPEIRRMKKDGVTPFPQPPMQMLATKPHGFPVTKTTEQAITNIPSSSHSELTTATSADISGGFGGYEVTDGIDYKIYGTEMQFVEIELDPAESAVAEAGAMMYKTAQVNMETIFGDGSEENQGFMGRLLGAGQRLLTNESLFTTVFTQQGNGKGRVAFGAPFPGTILALNLSEYDGKLICQKDSFLAAAKGVQIGIQFQRKILTGLFGGEGFVMQKLEGTGWVFVHMGGTLRKIELVAGEELHVDTGCLAALTQTVDYDIKKAGGIKTMLFGGEGIFFAKLTGPGTVWLQSLPFSRLAGRMLAAAPQTGGQTQGEGSVLGGLGNLLDGD